MTTKPTATEALPCCEDWPKQSKIISDCIVRESLRHGNDVYLNAGGQEFRFCPWCGASRDTNTRTPSPSQSAEARAPWVDEGGHSWEIKHGVTCVECPHCLFIFAAEHTTQRFEVDQWEGYDCPNCHGCPDALSTTQPTIQQAIDCVKGLRDEWKHRATRAPNETMKRDMSYHVDACVTIIAALESLSASTQPDGGNDEAAQATIDAHRDAQGQYL